MFHDQVGFIPDRQTGSLFENQSMQSCQKAKNEMIILIDAEKIFGKSNTNFDKALKKPRIELPQT